MGDRRGCRTRLIIEYRFRRPNGEVVWIQGFAAALRNNTGDVLGWVGTCLDLTDRKEAEQAILHESERFRAAFDDAPIGMALVAPDGTFLRVNQSLTSIPRLQRSRPVAALVPGAHTSGRP